MESKVIETALTVTYDTMLGPVSLSPETVKKYLAKGTSPLTDQEIALFINLCRYQKLNPFTGEAYAIKFGSDFQMVVGYEKFKNRADENPAYLGRTQGIVVMRGNEIVKKEGECLYPSEKLIGGWCKVRYIRNGIDSLAYKEPSFVEYDKGQANWKSQPCMMITKVAVSQALRDAFPKDYEGLYTPEEMKVIPAEYEDLSSIPSPDDVVIVMADKADRQHVYKLAKEKYGININVRLKVLYEECGIESSEKMTKTQYEILCEKIEADQYAAVDLETPGAADPAESK